MELENNLWATTTVKFKQFCAHCTLHGAYYFSDKSRWWLRCTWVVIVCCSMALCCFLGHMIWDKFIVDPTLTVVETTHYSTADIPFPAVTVCDTEMVYGSNTDNVTNLLVLRGYNRSQISEFYESFSDVRNMDYAPAAYVKKMHYLLDDLGFPLKSLLNMFKKPCDEILLECYWRSRPHNCTEMFRSVYTIMGYCCQFDILYFKKHTTTETNFVAGVQTTEALDFIVSGTKVSSDGNVTDGLMWLFVFDLKDRVTLIDNAIVLSPAAYFDVNVYLWAIDSSSYVKALNLQARKCILDTDPGIGTSFYQGCMSRLILKRVVDQCKCLPFEYSGGMDKHKHITQTSKTREQAVCLSFIKSFGECSKDAWRRGVVVCAEELDEGDYMACTWERLICVYKTIQKVEADVRDIISQNECYQRCDYVQYETEVEFIKNQRNLRDVENIHSRVAIHFSETTCMKYRREVLYTWDQMLANLGGIFGLCLGGSIVSVIEIIWFIFDLIFTITHEALTRKKIEPKAEEYKKYKNKVFIINQSIPKEGNKMLKTNRKDVNTKKLRGPSGGVKYKFIN